MEAKMNALNSWDFWRDWCILCSSVKGGIVSNDIVDTNPLRSWAYWCWIYAPPVLFDACPPCVLTPSCSTEAPEKKDEQPLLTTNPFYCFLISLPQLPPLPSSQFLSKLMLERENQLNLLFAVSSARSTSLDTWWSFATVDTMRTVRRRKRERSRRAACARGLRGCRGVEWIRELKNCFGIYLNSQISLILWFFLSILKSKMSLLMQYCAILSSYYFPPLMKSHVSIVSQPFFVGRIVSRLLNNSSSKCLTLACNTLFWSSNWAFNKWGLSPIDVNNNFDTSARSSSSNLVLVRLSTTVNLSSILPSSSLRAATAMMEHPLIVKATVMSAKIPSSSGPLTINVVESRLLIASTSNENSCSSVSCCNFKVEDLSTSMNSRFNNPIVHPSKIPRAWENIRFLFTKGILLWAAVRFELGRPAALAKDSRVPLWKRVVRTLRSRWLVIYKKIQLFLKISLSSKVANKHLPTKNTWDVWNKTSYSSCLLIEPRENEEHQRAAWQIVSINVQRVTVYVNSDSGFNQDGIALKCQVGLTDSVERPNVTPNVQSIAFPAWIMTIRYIQISKEIEL